MNIQNQTVYFDFDIAMSKELRAKYNMSLPEAVRVLENVVQESKDRVRRAVTNALSEERIEAWISEDIGVRYWELELAKLRLELCCEPY